MLDEGRWDTAKERVQGRTEGARDRMDAALERERSREEDLNDLFDKAKRKALGGKNPSDAEGPSNPLDEPGLS